MVIRQSADPSIVEVAGKYGRGEVREALDRIGLNEVDFGLRPAA